MQTTFTSLATKASIFPRSAKIDAMMYIAVLCAIADLFLLKYIFHICEEIGHIAAQFKLKF